MTHDSVFLRALGDEARLLQPEVYEYVAGPPEGYRTGYGHGVFEVAGSPYRRLTGLLLILTGPEVVLSSYERDVPFEIINRPVAGASGLSLEAERCFQFRRGSERFVDTLQVGRIPSTLVNTLGRNRRIELLLECSVTVEGNLSLKSKAARVRIGAKKFLLPKLFSVQAEAIDGWDAEREVRTIAVVVRNPVVGTVLRYRGWFRYQYLP